MVATTISEYGGCPAEDFPLVPGAAIVAFIALVAAFLAAVVDFLVTGAEIESETSTTAEASSDIVN